jgi:arachidonate 15-lipoxygenase
MPSLPQHDPKAQRRARALQASRDRLEYEYTYLDPVAMARTVPPEHRPGLPWLRTVGAVVLTILRNIHARHRQRDAGPATLSSRDAAAVEDATTQHIRELEVFMSPDIARTESAREAIDQAPTEPAERLASIAGLSLTERFLQALKGKIAHVVETYQTSAVDGRASDLASYDDLFQTVPRPEIAGDFDSDEMFAWQRVAGVNPTVIERTTGAIAGFPVTDAHLAAALRDPGDSLAAAGAEGRLYLARYALFDHLVGGSFPSEQKYLFAPTALFAVPRAGDDRRLRPVAIQCSQHATGDRPVITPMDGERWRSAKTIVQMADSNHHEAIAHLGLTHLFVEPFVVSTDRQLAAEHPVGILLRPHFEGTLFINDAAQSLLISARGVVDMLLGGTIESSRLAVNLGRANRPFASFALPTQLAGRGVDDPSCLPDYPYRDDALLVWAAVRDWVASYLALYYAGDADVQADFELQAWAAELAAHDGGRVEGFGEAGTIPSLAYLTDALTTVVFTASAQHAAVNFPQKDVMSYPPAMPLALYAPFAEGNDDYMGLLPPLRQALVQLHVTFLLGSVQHTRLGEYEPGHFADPRVGAALEDFQRALREIERTVTARNAKRRPYIFLLPSRIPQSINI